MKTLQITCHWNLKHLIGSGLTRLEHILGHWVYLAQTVM